MDLPIHTALPYPTRGHQELEPKDTNKPNTKLGREQRNEGKSQGRGNRKDEQMWKPILIILINTEYPLYTHYH